MLATPIQPPPPQAFVAFYERAFNKDASQTDVMITNMSCRRATARQGFTCSIVFLDLNGTQREQMTILWPSLKALPAGQPSGGSAGSLPCSVAETVPPIEAPGSGPSPPPGTPPPGCTPG
jgi:hypothetical protein